MVIKVWKVEICIYRSFSVVRLYNLKNYLFAQLRLGGRGNQPIFWKNDRMNFRGSYIFGMRRR